MKMYWKCGMHGGLYITEDGKTTPMYVGCSGRVTFDGDLPEPDEVLTEEEVLRILLSGELVG